MYNFFYRSNIMSRKLYIEDIVTNTPNVIPKTISIVQVTAANANISTINTNYANVNTIESLSIQKPARIIVIIAIAAMRSQRKKLGSIESLFSR